MNIFIKEIVRKTTMTYKFEDDLNLFADKHYVTSRFVRYVDKKGTGQQEEGLLGLIYPRVDNAGGKVYTVKKVDVFGVEENPALQQAPVQNVKVGKVSLDSSSPGLLFNISCGFDKEFEPSSSAVVSCFGNSKSGEGSFSDLAKFDFAFDQPAPKSVKTYPDTASERSFIQCGVLSCEKPNSVMIYNNASKKLEITHTDPYLKQQVTNLSEIALNLEGDEYIHSMIANSEWFEIQVRKKGVFSSPRRFIGSTGSKKLVPSSFYHSQFIDPKKDSFILSVQNAQTGESVYSRAGFFGLSLVAREFAKISILYDVEYYLTIKKPPQEALTESGDSLQSLKTVKITFTDKAT